MDIGMLWFDDSNRKLEEKISRAVEHYKQKYGQAPTVCFVNPETLRQAGGQASNGCRSVKPGPDGVAGVHVSAMRNVLPHHFWIGVGEPARSANGRGKNGDRAPARKKSGRREAV